MKFHYVFSNKRSYIDGTSLGKIHQSCVDCKMKSPEEYHYRKSMPFIKAGNHQLTMINSYVLFSISHYINQLSKQW